MIPIVENCLEARWLARRHGQGMDKHALKESKRREIPEQSRPPPQARWLRWLHAVASSSSPSLPPKRGSSSSLSSSRPKFLNCATASCNGLWDLAKPRKVCAIRRYIFHHIPRWKNITRIAEMSDPLLRQFKCLFRQSKSLVRQRKHLVWKLSFDYVKRLVQQLQSSDSAAMVWQLRIFKTDMKPKPTQPYKP